MRYRYRYRFDTDTDTDEIPIADTDTHEIPMRYQSREARSEIFLDYLREPRGRANFF